MGDKATLAVQVDKESDLYDDFEEYKQRGGFTSTSETLRHLMREEFEEDETPTGLAAATSKIAGDQVTRSMDLLSKYLIVTAAALIAFNAGVFGGVVWAGVAAVYTTLAVLTFIGVAVGVAEVVNPNGVASSSATESGDEADA